MDEVARLRAAGHHDVHAADHRPLEEARGLPGERAQGHQVVQAGRLHHEFAHIDAPATSWVTRTDRR
jgi:hypothetical protein